MEILWYKGAEDRFIDAICGAIVFIKLQSWREAGVQTVVSAAVTRAGGEQSLNIAHLAREPAFLSLITDVRCWCCQTCSFLHLRASRRCVVLLPGGDDEDVSGNVSDLYTPKQVEPLLLIEHLLFLEESEGWAEGFYWPVHCDQR